jgi:outer membrane protein OmpU
MKKQLLATTALVAGGLMAGAAQAADPIKLSLGGYAHSGLTIRGQDNTATANGTSNGQDDWFVQNNGLQVTTDIGRSDVFWEAEVWFVGETTLDNGIKVGVNIQLEAYTSNDQIDESYVYLTGGFGRLVIGAENSAPYIMHYAAPTPTGGQYGAESPNFSPFRSPTANGLAIVNTFSQLTSDANKITYYTPRFAPGFQFGISYTPDDDAFAGFQSAGVGGGTGCRGGCAFNAGNNVSDNDQTNHHHFVEAGMNFVRSVNGVDLAFDIGGGTGFIEKQTRTRGDRDRTLKQRYTASAGFNIGYAGWTFGAGGMWDNRGLQGHANEYHATAGVMYGAGPWLVGVNGGYAIRHDGDRATATAAGGYARRTNDTLLWVGAQGTYTLGPGVRVFSSIDYASWDGNGTMAEEGDGIAWSTGLLLNF